MTRFVAFYLFGISLLVASCLATDPPADRAYRNGTVFTADAQNPVAEAVAIRDGRIVYVGSNEGLIRFIGPATKVTDLKSGFLKDMLAGRQAEIHAERDRKLEAARQQRQQRRQQAA